MLPLYSSLFSLLDGVPTLVFLVTFTPLYLLLFPCLHWSLASLSSRYTQLGHHRQTYIQDRRYLTLPHSEQDILNTLPP